MNNFNETEFNLALKRAFYTRFKGKQTYLQISKNLLIK